MPDKAFRPKLASVGRDRGDFWQIDGGTALRLLMCHRNYVGGFSSFMFRRSAWQAVGGIDESFRISADFNFHASLATQGDFACIPKSLYFYRQHEGCHSSDEIKTILDGSRVYERCLRKRPVLRRDSEVRRHIKTLLYHIADCAENEHRILDGVRCYLQLLRIWPFDKGVHWRLIKFGFRRLRQAALTRP